MGKTMNIQLLIRYAVLFLIILFALYYDWKFKEIPNFLIISGILTWFLIYIANWEKNSFIIGYFIELLSIFSLFLLFWYKKWIGGGDFKLICLVLIYLYPNESISVIIFLKIALSDRLQFLLFFSICNIFTYFFYSRKNSKSIIFTPFILTSLLFAYLF
ncbi:MAG: prepilin peptidase [Promethearchaeota archaeon]